MGKKLVRPSDDRLVSGVLGSFANYFNFDATLIRLVFVVGLIFSGFFPLALIYVAAIFIIPNERETH